MKLTGLALLFAFWLSACVSEGGHTSFGEVARVTSPDDSADAILVETNGGATTSFGYLVFVVPKGVRLKSKDEKYLVASLYRSTRNANAYGANLKWPTKEELAIEYFAGGAGLVQSSVNFANYDVNVKLRSGVEDASAPPGGMLHNNLKNSNRE